jgi:pyrimidine operon attenuation protein/uracil phosphoribosyltransferase
MDFGRPRRLELAAVVDRGGRELPIQPDYVLRTLEVAADERVDLIEEPAGLRVLVQPLSSPSSFPPPP